jgi:hypothetical protein
MMAMPGIPSLTLSQPGQVRAAVAWPKLATASPMTAVLDPVRRDVSNGWTQLLPRSDARGFVRSSTESSPPNSFGS